VFSETKLTEQRQNHHVTVQAKVMWAISQPSSVAPKACRPIPHARGCVERIGPWFRPIYDESDPIHPYCLSSIADQTLYGTLASANVPLQKPVPSVHTLTSPLLAVCHYCLPLSLASLASYTLQPFSTHIPASPRSRFSGRHPLHLSIQDICSFRQDADLMWTSRINLKTWPLVKDSAEVENDVKTVTNMSQQDSHWRKAWYWCLPQPRNHVADNRSGRANKFAAGTDNIVDNVELQSDRLCMPHSKQLFRQVYQSHTEVLLLIFCDLPLINDSIADAWILGLLLCLVSILDSSIRAPSTKFCLSRATSVDFPSTFSQRGSRYSHAAMQTA